MAEEAIHTNAFNWLHVALHVPDSEYVGLITKNKWDCGPSNYYVMAGYCSC